MNPWQKESLNLQVGDWIIWQDIAIKTEDGTVFVSPGMKGQVVDLHNGCAPSKLDAVDNSVLPWAFVKWENGETSRLELGMKWEIAE